MRSSYSMLVADWRRPSCFWLGGEVNAEVQKLTGPEGSAVFEQEPPVTYDKTLTWLSLGLVAVAMVIGLIACVTRFGW